MVPIAGIHSVRTALAGDPERVVEVWLWRRRRDQRLGEIAALARAAGIPLRQVEQEALDRVAAKHQGVIAWVQMPSVRGEKDLWHLLEGLREPPLLLVLDGVQDPHNLGACLRTADATGVHAVLSPKDQTVGLTATVFKVASGAAQSVPFVQVTNLARTLDQLKERGIWLLGTAADAETLLYQEDLRGPLGIVMGSEGKGLRRLIRSRCDFLARLPLFGRVESLNLSVATGVCLYEALRQRTQF